MPRLSAADRRAQIVEAAHAVIVEKGLAEAATRDVTRRLNVGSGLLHHYYPSWTMLRAEAVETFVMAEIAEIERLIDSTQPDEAVGRLIDWLADDPGLRHWGMWLNAVEVARRDAEMAAVIRTAHATWHEVLTGLIQRLVLAQYGHCDDPAAAAWRLSALIDGVAGVVLLGGAGLDVKTAKALLHRQFDLELGR